MNDDSKFSVRSDVKKMAKTILEVVEVAELNGVVCWLNYGALLGMIRENRLLPWNNDAELCCLYTPGLPKKFKLIVDHLNKIGYSAYFYSSIGALAVKTHNTVVNVNCIWIENKSAVRPHETASEKGYAPSISRIFYWIGTFFVAYPSGFVRYKGEKFSGKLVLKSTLITLFRILPIFLRKKLFLLMIIISQYLGGDYKKTVMPSKYFKEFEKIKFYDGQVYVPKSPHNLLRYIYGEDWQTPKENWSFYDKKNKKQTNMIFKDEKWNYSDTDFL